ncbi:MAG: diaminopimelate decarboxylase [Clostridiales bacterium]|nr:diaminopimelate decarboxylase [Clostridiales bacterium]
MKKNSNVAARPLACFGDLTVKDGRLSVGGCFASDLAKEYGTPLYVFDVERAQKTAKAYVDILKREYPDFTVCYASKAFCCAGIYEILAPLGLGADVVSGGELYTALKGGMDPSRIYFHGNNKTESEIKYAISSGVECFVVDSVRELELISAHAKKPQNVLVRVNPGVEAHTHRFIQTTTTDSKFGFSIADGTAEEIILSVSNYKNVHFVGLACHIGSQIFEKQSFEIAIDKMTDFIVRLNSLGIEVERLDLGGGFGIHYIEEDKPLTPEQYMENSARYLKTATRERNIKPPRLIVEPGRSIVGEAGITLYTVGAIKTIKDVKTYAAVDGGMFDNPRVSLYDAQYSAVIADKADRKGECEYSIAGKCCESGDILIEGIKLPELKTGDVLAVLSTGAYHYSMASNYNRNAVPPVVAVKGGKSAYMVKPQTYEDIARNDVISMFSEDKQ